MLHLSVVLTGFRDLFFHRSAELETGTVAVPRKFLPVPGRTRDRHFCKMHRVG